VTAGDAPRVAILAPMPNELRPVVRLLGLQRTGERGGMPVYTGTVDGTEVVATRTGIGPALAEAATEQLLAATDVDRVVVVGIAGGLEPVSAVGDLVVPEEAVDDATGERFRATPAGGVTPRGVVRTGDEADYGLDDGDVARLRDAGFTALDMETAAIARVCQRRGIPWLAFRAISDMAGDSSLGPVVMTLVDPEGRPRAWPSIRFLLSRPHKIPHLVRLGRDARAATTTAAEAAAAHLRGGEPAA
jgi:adenosylhomocysteine nucleosidase